MAIIYLLLSITCSTIIIVIFRLFKRFEVDNLQAIVWNYWVCVGIGTLLSGGLSAQGSFWEEPWFVSALWLGLLFVSSFYAVALTIQRFNLTLATVMQKMSLIITVSFAIYFYQEQVDFFKISGIALALFAVWFTNTQSKGKKISVGWSWLWPLFVLLSNGVIECVLQYVKLSILGAESELGFILFLFGTAGSLGLLAIVAGLLMGRIKLSWRNLLAGLALGIPNYGSIYFLFQVLGSGWDSSVAFTLNNVSIIALTAVLGFLVFKERLSKLNLLGVSLAIISIILIAFSG